MGYDLGSLSQPLLLVVSIGVRYIHLAFQQWPHPWRYMQHARKLPLLHKEGCRVKRGRGVKLREGVRGKTERVGINSRLSGNEK